MAELPKVDLESKDLVAERIEQMKALFPEIITEGNGTVDFEKLRLILGDEVEEGDERYSFVWPGKANAIRQSQAVTTATLIPKPDESVNWDTTENLYIEGDNLEVLKLLQRGYHGKIRLIYIDPPYNTGSDFVYHDSFEDSVENYRIQAGLAGQSNPDTGGRYHSDWCSMIYPRIKLARELLTPDGCFCVQIDDNEYCNMKKICDEIFGANCFMTTIVVKMSEPTGMKMAHADTRIPKLKEYILVYFKEEHPRLGEVRIPKERWDNEYKTFLEGITKDEVQEIKSIRDNEDRTASDVARCDEILSRVTYISLGAAYSKYNVATGDQNDFNYENAWRIVQTVSMTGGAKQLADEKKRTSGELFYSIVTPQGKMYLIKGDYSDSIEKPRIKILFADDYLTVNPCDFWQDIKTTGLDNEGYVDFRNGKKPLRLIRRLLTLFLKRGDIVLDFFSGSGTTGHALYEFCEENNGSDCHFILVQLPEDLDAKSASQNGTAKKETDALIRYLDSIGKPHYLSEVGKQRLRLAGEAITANAAPHTQSSIFDNEVSTCIDTGFRVFKLSDSGVQRPQDGQLLIDRIKPNRTDLDIVFEMLLKWGLELTYPIETDEIEGYPVYSIAYDELICCMQPGLNTDVLEAIAARNPRRVFLLDSVIDDTIKLNALQIFKRVEERTQQKIDLRTV